jgi:hypothetical protein
MTMKKYYGQLQGCVIEKFVGFVHEGGDCFPTFILRAPNGDRLKIEVSRDPEGNGAGFLFVSDVVDGVLPADEPVVAAAIARLGGTEAGRTAFLKDHIAVVHVGDEPEHSPLARSSRPEKDGGYVKRYRPDIDTVDGLNEVHGVMLYGAEDEVKAARTYDECNHIVDCGVGNPEGRWYLLLDRSEFQTDDLGIIEARLALWIVDEYGLGNDNNVNQLPEDMASGWVIGWTGWWPESEEPADFLVVEGVGRKIHLHSTPAAAQASMDEDGESITADAAIRCVAVNTKTGSIISDCLYAEIYPDGEWIG